MKLFWIVQGLLFVMLLPSIDALYAQGFAKETLVYCRNDTLRPAKCIKKVCKRALRKQTKVLSYNFEKKVLRA